MRISTGWTTEKRIIYTKEGKTMQEQEVDLQKRIGWSDQKEDHEISERLQEGQSSPASKQGGFLSPHWETRVQAFQKLIINATMKGKKNVQRSK